MRKIEEEMNKAIESRTPWQKDNTEVLLTDEGFLKVKLHGNTIAFETSKGWHITCAGWNTVTTRSRLRALAHVIGSDLFKNLYMENGKLFIVYGSKNIPIADNESFCVN